MESHALFTHQLATTIATTLLLAAVLAALAARAATNATRLFAPKHARNHRLAGLLLLVAHLANLPLLLLGPDAPLALAGAMDLLLPALGLLATLTAAADFRKAHARVSNVGSGTLEQSATVTHAEMVEHAFYQLLNLVQVCQLHALASAALRRQPRARALLALAATSPWLVRHRFPVNPFSANWTRGQRGLEPVLYRIKAAQYLLYKHALLHGLNASAAAAAGAGLARAPGFRLYWACLNLSYVSEFFLNTLVKRRYMSQPAMLVLQNALMLASSLAALDTVVRHVQPVTAALSLVFNLCARGHELPKMACVLLVAFASDASV